MSLTRKASHPEFGNALVAKHPLQRLPSPSRTTSLIVHVLGLSSFSYSWYYLVANPNQINESYGWHLQYLTIIGLFLATVTFFFAILADLAMSPVLFRVKNTLAVASTPMEILVTCLYWGLRSIDTKLVLPDWAPPLSLLDDFSFHLFPPLFLSFDLLFLSPPTAMRALPALALASVFGLGYWFWVEACYEKNGFYPYPIFAQLEREPRMGLFVGSAVVYWLSWITLREVYGWANGKELQENVLRDREKQKM